MFAKLKSALSNYFLPQHPNDDYIYFIDEFGSYSYYSPTEREILGEKNEPSYVQPFVEKP